jgi:uncharacterized damage-inducible protein DinB
MSIRAKRIEEGSNTMEEFIEESRNLLSQSFLPRIMLCVQSLSDEQLWWRPNEESNSIGNLILHLSGNVRQWIVSGVGHQPDVRERNREFAQREILPRDDLLNRLRQAVAEADEVLVEIRPSDLLKQRTIQGNEVTVLQAMYHVVEHFSMHTGQIILLTKMLSANLSFYNFSEQGKAKSMW